MKYSDVISPPDQKENNDRKEFGSRSLKLLDTASDRELNDLCKLAAFVCNMGKVYICLFEEYPGEISYNYDLITKDCPDNLRLYKQHIEQHHDLLVIPDILDDDRFVAFTSGDNQDVDRFLISVSLTDTAGGRLGVLTLLDPHPGQLGPDQVQPIHTVAHQIENLLELRKTNNELSSQQEQFQRIVEHSPNIVYRFSQVPGESYHSPRAEEVLGYSTHQLKANPSLWRDSIHPGDLTEVDRAVAETKHGIPIDLTYRIRTKSGEWRWLHDRSVNIIDNKGNIYIEGVASDVTRQKRNEETLVAKTEYIKSLLTAIPDMFFVISKEGVFLEVKAGNKEDLLQPESEFIGQYISDVLDHDLCNRLTSAIQNVLANQSGSTVEYELMLDGEKRVFEGRVTPLGSEKVIVLVRNVTQEKAVFKKLRVSEEAFRGSFENAAVGMALVGNDGEWLKVNQTVSEILGYNRDELANLTFHDVTHPDDLDKDLELLNQIIDGTRDHYQLEKRYLHKNGSVIHAILAVSTVKNSEGEILYYISQVVDITPLKQAKLKLASALAKNQAILDSSVNTAIIGTDLHGIIQTFNTGAENLTGYSLEEVLEKKSPDLFHLPGELEEHCTNHPDDCDGFHLLISSFHEQTSEFTEWTYVRKDGSQIPVQLSVSPIKSNNDEVTGYLMMATDMSSIKKADYELRQLVELAQSQNGRLKNFAGIVSHNLRNHAANIDGLINLLEAEIQEVSENEYYSYLKLASENLVNTIKNLSDITHLNDVDESKMESINLSEYIDRAIQNVSALACKEGVNIIHQPGKEAWISGVPAYLDSIVLNFITNGIRYRSDQRESFVKLSASSAGNYTVLTVEDNGLGIDLEEHGDKLFGEYNTFHDHPDSRGIGLFITKNQVDSMGGHIEVDSKPGKGTTFRIYFKTISS